MNHNWYAVLTAKVLLAKDINDKQKLMVALISNLSNEKGYCFASNKYLGDCLNCSEVTIRQNLAQLEELGYLGRVIKLNEKNEVDYRSLTVIEAFTPPIENNRTPDGIQSHPPDEIQSYNNKLINNKEEYNSDLSFEVFWDLFDKKVDRDKCESKWKKLPVSEKKKILKCLPSYINSTPDKKYRKNPLTWINGRCWLDNNCTDTLFTKKEDSFSSGLERPMTDEEYENFIRPKQNLPATHD